MIYLKSSLMKMVSPAIFLVQEHLNRMMLWKGIIDPYKRWIKHLLVSLVYKTIFGQKLLTEPATF